MNNFQSLLLSKRLRTVIDRLPIIPAVHLETEPEWRRAYSILAFMANGYIWGGEKPSEVRALGRYGRSGMLTWYRNFHLPSHILYSRSAHI
jgi:hypothetical protein